MTTKGREKTSHIVPPEGLEWRNAWILKHQASFQPFLPENFFLAFKETATNTPKSQAKQLETLTKQPGCIVGGELRDYQLTGVNFFIRLYNNGLNGILGDEMGLGKTLQTISFFGYLKLQGIKGPHLVVCPLSVLTTWTSELKRWCPSLKVVCFHGVREEREREKTVIKNTEYDVCVTTYEMLESEVYFFVRNMWKYLVLDEGHIIRNEENVVSKVARRVNAHHRIILTGTPIHNNLHELWALFHFLMPDIFTLATADIMGSGYQKNTKTWDTQKLTQAHTLLSLMILRRLKADVEKGLPNLEEVKVYVPLSPMQRFWYKRILRRGVDIIKGITSTSTSSNDIKSEPLGIEASFFQEVKLEDVKAELKTEPVKLESVKIEPEDMSIEGSRQKAEEEEDFSDIIKLGGDWKKQLMALMVQLRKACLHPFVFPNSEPYPFQNNENLVKACSKFELLDKLLPKLKAKRSRVLIYSQFVMMLDILEDYCNLRGFIYTRLDGSTNKVKRNINVRLYNREGSDVFIFLISTKAGGLGLNLATADTVIMYDSDFNPQNDLQAQARAHRIGQTRDVTVYRLVTKDTIEEYLVAAAERKLYLSAVVAEGGSVEASDNSGVYLKAIQFGANIICQPPADYNEFLKMDVDTILNKSEDIGGRITNSEYTTSNFKSILESKPVVDWRELDGERLVTGYRSIADEWHDLMKRNRKERIVMIDGYAVMKDTIEPEKPPEPQQNKRKMVMASGHEETCFVCNKEIGKAKTQKTVKSKTKKKAKAATQNFVDCRKCPRSYHPDCIAAFPKSFVDHFGKYLCPQHYCASCNRTSSAAGGVLYVCISCPSAYCDDCLPSDEINEIGFEYEPMAKYDYHDEKHVYYIKCDICLNPTKLRELKPRGKVVCGVSVGSFIAIRPDPVVTREKFWIAEVLSASENDLHINWLERIGNSDTDFEMLRYPTTVARGTVIKYDVIVRHDPRRHIYVVCEDIKDSKD